MRTRGKMRGERRGRGGIERGKRNGMQ